MNLKETEDLELDSTNLTILTRLFRSNKQPLPFKLNSTKKEVDTIVEVIMRPSTHLSMLSISFSH